MVVASTIKGEVVIWLAVMLVFDRALLPVTAEWALLQSLPIATKSPLLAPVKVNLVATPAMPTGGENEMDFTMPDIST